MAQEHGGIPAIVTAARAAGPQGRRAVATLLAELSLNPNQRQVVDRSGGLLVLLGFQRSLDGDERIQAELALRNFSHDTLHIHLALARSSVDVSSCELKYFGELSLTQMQCCRPFGCAC